MSGYLIALCLAGGPVHRIAGGWPKTGSNNVSKGLFALLAAVWVAVCFNEPWAYASAFTWFAGRKLGWGSYMDMGRGPWEDNESIRPVVKWLAQRFGRNRSLSIVGSRAYDLLGMTVRGIVLTLPTGLLIEWFASPLAGIIVILGGAMLGPIYWAAWRVFEGRKLPPTEVAEVVTGVWLFALVLLASRV